MLIITRYIYIPIHEVISNNCQRLFLYLQICLRTYRCLVCSYLQEPGDSGARIKRIDLLPLIGLDRHTTARKWKLGHKIWPLVYIQTLAPITGYRYFWAEVATTFATGPIGAPNCVCANQRLHRCGEAYRSSFVALGFLYDDDDVRRFSSWELEAETRQFRSFHSCFAET